MFITENEIIRSSWRQMYRLLDFLDMFLSANYYCFLEEFISLLSFLLSYFIFQLDYFLKVAINKMVAPKITYYVKWLVSEGFCNSFSWH